jgi:hypothetical protein
MDRPDIGNILMQAGSTKDVCPFCGLHVEWGTIEKPEHLAGSLVLTHADPMCNLFENTHPGEFILLTKKRRSMAN